jgi:hypothetical protein
MISRDVVRNRVRLAARGLTGFGRNLEKECARMNDGLTAIAIALTVVVVLTAAVRLPVIFPDAGKDAAMLQDED